MTDAVHARGGHLSIQLMHAGRISHPDNTPHHAQGVAPSAIAPGIGMYTPTGMQDIPVPRPLSTDEVRQTAADFAGAARRAVGAGADGVEIHGANAYLVQQFLAPSANNRTDAYGGSIENRARFALEVAKAIAAEIGADRTAIRLSPGLTSLGIDEGAEEPVGADVTSGVTDLEAYGAMVLANPDFVARLEGDAPMSAPQRAGFFGGTERFYTDYPNGLCDAQRGGSGLRGRSRRKASSN